MMVSFPYRQFLLKLVEKSGYASLQQREKILVATSVLVLLIIVLFQFILEPLLESRKQLQAIVGRKQQELVEIKVMSREYLDLKSQAGGVKDRMSKRSPNFSLFSFLDKQATKTKVKGQVKYMKPSSIDVDDLLQESIVEIKLHKITLRQLVNFLEVIEPEEHVVFVRRLSIQESGKEKGYLDAVLQVVTFVLKST